MSKEKRPLEQLAKELKPTLGTKDEKAITEIFDEIISYKDEEPQQVEGLLGWGVLVACEFRLKCTGKYLPWFMQTFPQSLMPVKVEYADYLATTKQEDLATQLAREYLRLVLESGKLDSNINQSPNIFRGTSKAFAILTVAYTLVGARSYSRRIMEYASKFPMDPFYMDLYKEEIKRLEEELLDPENKSIDESWEAFFKDGTNVNELFDHCRQNSCEMLAERTGLLEGNFRFNPNFKIDESEMFLLIFKAKTEQGNDCKVLR